MRTARNLGVVLLLAAVAFAQPDKSKRPSPPGTATPRILATPKASAYIKIAEGCDHPCGFCIIPQLRGKFRSRHFESVMAEAQRLASNGVREITLIGQDTTCYGEDLGLKDGLPLLLERLAQIEELRWVRFLYAYPNKITGRLLETMAAHEKICSYIDVPLQHASSSVLKRMKRGAGAEIFLRNLRQARFGRRTRRQQVAFQHVAFAQRRVVCDHRGEAAWR